MLVKYRLDQIQNLSHNNILTLYLDIFLFFQACTKEGHLMKQTNFQVLFDYKDFVYMYILIKAQSQYIFKVFNICLNIHTYKKTNISVTIFRCVRSFFLDSVFKKKNQLDHITVTCFCIFRDGKEDILNLKEENFIMQKIQR